MVSVYQDGADVKFESTGTVDLTGLTYSSTTNIQGFVTGSTFLLGANPGVSVAVDIYTGLTSSPGSFGSSALPSAIGGTGPRWGLGTNLAVPTGFSGGALESSLVFQNATIGSLDLIPDTYVWTLPNDTVTMTIESVPLPAAAWLIGSGLISAGIVRRRKKKAR